MKKFKIDARGLDCPKPLLRTKEAIAREDFDVISVKVSNAAAKENILRFLGHSGFSSIEARELENGEYSISGIKGSAGEEAAEEGSAASAAPEKNATGGEAAAAAGCTVLIASDRMGMGKKELGKLLLKGYVYTLTQLDTPPDCLIFMNTGVKLTLDDSDSLDDLKALEEKGTRLMVCGTCLDFLEVRSRMKIGLVSNMYDIAGELHGPAKVITLT